MNRRSGTDDAVWVMVEGLQRGAQALAFTRTRQAAELVARYAQDRLREMCSPLADQMRSYRGGYLPNDRRQIEQEMFAGRLRGIAATNALELGIDIGSLDMALLVHYPGTIASTWQQAGRSGRRQDESLAILFAGPDPIDQYLLRHPEYFFAQSPEHAVVDPANPYVLANHLKAAAFELPLDEADTERFGPLSNAIAQILCEEKDLSAAAGKIYFSGGQNPAHRISLRHMSDETFSIVLAQEESPEHEVIANVDAISAPELIYPQAVYLHHGETYFIRSLDLAGKVAYAERAETDYYTQAILDSRVQITFTRELAENDPNYSLGLGSVDVSWQTVAFKKIKFETRENVGYGKVDLPAQHLPTTAFWLTPTQAVHQAMKADSLRTSEGLCGLRNLMVQALPMIAMCDSRDISGVVDSQNFGTSTMILYDRYPGGLGYCEKGFDQIHVLLTLCQQLVAECPCDDGCPSCVGLPNLRPAIHSDPDLTRGYPIPDKQATRRLVSLMTPSGAAQPIKQTDLARLSPRMVRAAGTPA
jgi:DEAD/DEAH box helicase domain-containing protein